MATMKEETSTKSSSRLFKRVFGVFLKIIVAIILGVAVGAFSTLMILIGIYFIF